MKKIHFIPIIFVVTLMLCSCFKETDICPAPQTEVHLDANSTITDWGEDPDGDSGKAQQ